MQTKRYNITTTVWFVVDEDKDPEKELKKKLKTMKTNLIFDKIKILWENTIQTPIDFKQ